MPSWSLGLDLSIALSDEIALYAKYSYLSNQYRYPVSWAEDTWGEQQAFVGVQLTFGSGN